MAIYQFENCEISDSGFPGHGEFIFYGHGCEMTEFEPDQAYEKSQSVSVVNVPALDIMVDSTYVQSTLTATFIMFAIGLGVGQAIKFLGKLR